MLLGRAKSSNDSRMLHMHDYVSVDALPIPPVHDMFDSTAVWPMLANDRFNCCTSAAAGHMVHHWTAANQRSIFLTDKDIITAHARLTSDHLMTCVSMADALKFWRKIGIGHHRIHSFVSVGRPRQADLCAAIYVFGGAYVGLDLPNFAYTGDPRQIADIPWQIPTSVSMQDSEPQTSNGHCVAAIGYDDRFVYAVTWGRLKMMTWEFFLRYVDEAYAVLSTDWVQHNLECPSGFDIRTLNKDLSRIAAVPSM